MRFVCLCRRRRWRVTPIIMNHRHKNALHIPKASHERSARIAFHAILLNLVHCVSALHCFRGNNYLDTIYDFDAQQVKETHTFNAHTMVNHIEKPVKNSTFCCLLSLAVYKSLMALPVSSHFAIYVTLFFFSNFVKKNF